MEIGWLDLLHLYTELERYRWSPHFRNHVDTVSHLNFHESHRSNGFITVSLSLQITHEALFAQPNSFLAISSQLFCQLPILLCICHLFSLIFAELNSRLTALLELRISTDLNVLFCPFYNPSARDRTKETVHLLFHEFVCAETCLPSRSIATA
jgi:hypothetical protein